MKSSSVANLPAMAGVWVLIVLAGNIVVVGSQQSFRPGVGESMTLIDGLSGRPADQRVRDAEFEEKMIKGGFTKINGVWAPQKIPLSLRLAVGRL